MRKKSNQCPKKHKKKDKKHRRDHQGDWSDDNLQQIQETSTSTVQVSPSEGVIKKKKVKIYHDEDKTAQ